MYRYIFFNWIRASFILFHFLIYIHISICTFFSNWKESPRRFSSLNLNDLAETIVMLTYCVWCWNFGVPVAFPLSLSSMRLNTTVLMVSWRFFCCCFRKETVGIFGSATEVAEDSFRMCSARCNSFVRGTWFRRCSSFRLLLIYFLICLVCLVWFRFSSGLGRH